MDVGEPMPLISPCLAIFAATVPFWESGVTLPIFVQVPRRIAFSLCNNFTAVFTVFFLSGTPFFDQLCNRDAGPPSVTSQLDRATRHPQLFTGIQAVKVLLNEATLPRRTAPVAAAEVAPNDTAVAGVASTVVTLPGPAAVGGGADLFGEVQPIGVGDGGQIAAFLAGHTSPYRASRGVPSRYNPPSSMVPGFCCPSRTTQGEEGGGG